QAFEAVVMRCLSKDMKDRPQTVRELAVALRPFASAEVQLSVDRIARIGGPPRSQQPSIPEALPSSPGDRNAPSLPGRVHSTTGFADTVGATSQAMTVGKGRRTTMILVAGGALAAGGGGGGGGP